MAAMYLPSREPIRHPDTSKATHTEEPAMRLFWSLVLSSTLASTAVFAMGSKPEPTEPSSPPATSSGMPSDESGPRLEAERSYADGYDQVTKAKKDLDAGKAKNAEKKFKKAL